MYMKRFSGYSFFVSILFFLNPVSTIKAQDYSSFDLNKYVTPDVVRNQLDFNFAGNFLNVNHGADTLSNSQTTSNANLNSSFYRYVNTRKRITEFSAGLALMGNSSRLKSQESKNTDYSWYHDLSLDYNTRLFLTKSKLHFVLGASFSWVFNNDDRNDKAASLVQHSLTFAPKLGLGFGRIEDVTDARQAIYMLEALHKNGVLSRQLSNEEVVALAQKISSEKNKRFFDSRLHKIDEISAVDSFFVASKALSKNDASYFTALYDMWDYGALFQRKSGWQFDFVLTPALDYKWIKNYSTSSVGNDWGLNKNNTLGSSAVLSFDFEKAASLRIQHSFSADLSGNYMKTNFKNLQLNESTTKSDYDKKTGALSVDYKLGYYLNTRTNFNLLLGSCYTLSGYDNRSTNKDFSFHLGANVNYYFSPRLKLVAQVETNHLYSRYSGKDDTNHHNSVSASLTYSLF